MPDATILLDLLPLALAVAVSPVPVALLIVALLSRRAQASALAFLVTWVVVTFAVPALGGIVLGGADPNGTWTHPIAAIQVALGVLLVVFGLIQFRPVRSDTARQGWIRRVRELSPARLALLTAGLLLLNPKDLTLLVSAAITAGNADLAVGTALLTAALFSAVASSTVIVPVVAFLVARDRVESALQRIERWLLDHDQRVTAIVLLVVGVLVTLQGVNTLRG